MQIKTVQQIAQHVLTKIGLVTGSAVQTYTEPQINDAIYDAFNLLFRKRFWEHLSDWYTVTLNGTTGLVTTDLTNIVRSFEDAKNFHIPNSGRRIVKPEGTGFRAISGSTPIYYTPLKYSDANFVTRVFKFWPITATGDVAFYARTHPGDLTPSSSIPFPYDLVAYAAAWLTLESDGLNPGKASIMQNLFQITYNDFVASIGDDVIGHGGDYNAHTVWPS